MMRTMTIDRPKFPADYGIPDHQNNLLPWSYVQERMAEARNVWICSIRPDGSPHCMPVWSTWIDDRLYIEGSLETRRARNLLANPMVNAHLESGDQVITIDGIAYEISRPEAVLGERLSKAYTAKYSDQGYSPTPAQWDHGGLFAITPHTVMAWTKFPEDVTRYRFS